MTQPPVEPDEPIGGSLTPVPEGDQAPPPPPPPPSSGGSAYPPPPPTGGSAYPPPPPPTGGSAYPPPPGGSAYPPAYPSGSYPPPAADAFPPAFPPPGPFAVGGMRPHRGPLVLGLGIAGLLCCGPLGIAAFLMGRQDLADMNAGRMDPTGRSMTNIGRITGIVAIVYFVVQLVWIALSWGSLSTPR